MADSSLTNMLLRHARDNAGAVTLKAIRDTVMSAVVNNGRIMISAAGGGKSYTFLQGLVLNDVIGALNRAEQIYTSYSDDEITELLSRRPVSRTHAAFR